MFMKHKLASSTSISSIWYAEFVAHNLETLLVPGYDFFIFPLQGFVNEITCPLFSYVVFPIFQGVSNSRRLLERGFSYKLLVLCGAFVRGHIRSLINCIELPPSTSCRCFTHPTNT